MRLQNSVAIVTGARQGIGRGIALALAREGAAVVVSDLVLEDCKQVVSEIQAMGGRAMAIVCDVSDKGAVDTMIEKTVAEYGKLDILVNNAGIYPFVPFMSMTEADWDKVMNVNLKSVFLCSQAAARVMPDHARIVTISSIASMVGFEGLTHYSATKGGINSLTRTLALELAPRRITVNAVAPGAIETPGAAAPEEVKQQTIAAVPLKRMGTPDDIAEAVVYLASPGASYVTGQTIVVDGGWTLR